MFGMESIRPIMKNRVVPIVLFELESVKLHFQVSWNYQFFFPVAFPDLGEQNPHVRPTKLHLIVNGCFDSFSLLAQIYRSCFAASVDSQSKDHCCGVSSQMTDLGWSLNSFAKAVVALSSSIHTVLSVWLVQLISGIKSDRMAFSFSGRSYLVRERDVVYLSCVKAVIGKYRTHRTVTPVHLF